MTQPRPQWVRVEKFSELESILNEGEPHEKP